MACETVHVLRSLCWKLIINANAVGKRRTPDSMSDKYRPEYGQIRGRDASEVLIEVVI